jgi:hypothetical protein
MRLRKRGNARKKLVINAKSVKMLKMNLIIKNRKIFSNKSDFFLNFFSKKIFFEKKTITFAP